jgi:hypothetical protein
MGAPTGWLTQSVPTKIERIAVSHRPAWSAGTATTPHKDRHPGRFQLFCTTEIALCPLTRRRDMRTLMTKAIHFRRSSRTLLTQFLRKKLPDQPRHGIVSAACRKRNDPAHGSVCASVSEKVVNKTRRLPPGKIRGALSCVGQMAGRTEAAYGRSWRVWRRVDTRGNTNLLM